MVRFGKRGKLNPCYIGPFEILARIGPVAYKLKLPQELQNVHDTFHVSNLKKCLTDETLIIPFEEIQVNEKLNFVEEPVEIMDREIKRLKQCRIPIVKVIWSAKRGPEFTWEREDQMKQKYPHLFPNSNEPATSWKFRDEIPLTGGWCDKWQPSKFRYESQTIPCNGQYEFKFYIGSQQNECILNSISKYYNVIQYNYYNSQQIIIIHLGFSYYTCILRII